MRIAALNDILPDTSTWTEDGLAIGGVALSALAQEYGTPLYVYDEATIRNTARRLKAAFAPLGARVSYACKACSSLGVMEVFQDEGLDLDVVSGGELEAGLRCGFNASQVHMHGNCKSNAELEVAMSTGVHAIVVDNAAEIGRLVTICAQRGHSARIMIRVQLGLKAETHPHLQTSGRQSKFGIATDEVPALLETVRGHECLSLIGVHAHLGSQIGDLCMYARAALELIQISRVMNGEGHEIEEVSVGGGWEVPYRPGDQFVTPEDVAAAITPAFQNESGLRPAVEPGRWLVGRAAIALYCVGNVKTTAGRRLVAVDGGMADNPRPALYGAAYHALLSRTGHPSVAGTADIVGRYCEAGDILARDVELPETAAGDILCIPVSGAYQLAMASAYNLVPQPAVVMVAKGAARLITRRATIEDVLSREITRPS